MFPWECSAIFCSLHVSNIWIDNLADAVWTFDFKLTLTITGSRSNTIRWGKKMGSLVKHVDTSIQSKRCMMFLLLSLIFFSHLSSFFLPQCSAAALGRELYWRFTTNCSCGICYISTENSSIKFRCIMIAFSVLKWLKKLWLVSNSLSQVPRLLIIIPLKLCWYLVASWKVSLILCYKDDKVNQWYMKDWILVMSTQMRKDTNCSNGTGFL